MNQNQKEDNNCEYLLLNFGIWQLKKLM